MLLGNVLKSCLGCEPMGSMCAKEGNTEPGHEDHYYPRRGNKGANQKNNMDKKDDLKQPLVDADSIKANKDNDTKSEVNMLGSFIIFIETMYIIRHQRLYIYITANSPWI